jgi:hypothetical protein
MRNLKYLFILMLLGFIVPSCVEDTAPEDEYGKAANLASFTNASMNLSAVADGQEYQFDVPMKVKGPSLANISSPVTATISVDPSSTAVEGVHFRLDQTTVTFDPNNNLLNLLPVTVLTAGIDAPLAEAPKLVLNISNVTGGDNVIANGKTVTLNLLYLCFSDLAGDYVVSIQRSDNGVTYVYDETIVATANGYRGVSVGHYAPGSLGGEPGFDFVDVCGVITVPLQNLVNLYSNEVYGIGTSYVKENGDLHIEYEITFAAGNRQYIADYVKQ